MTKNKKKQKRAPATRSNASFANQLCKFLDGASYQGMQKVRLIVPAFPDLYTTTVTTGVIATIVGLDPTARISGWTTRFASTFLEYRIRSIRIDITTMTQSSGIAVVWFTEENEGTPVYTEAQTVTSDYVQLSNAGQRKLSRSWRPHDTSDLIWTAIGTSNLPVYYSVYTDNTHFGSPIAATQVLMVHPVFDIEFRGLRQI